MRIAAFRIKQVFYGILIILTIVNLGFICHSDSDNTFLVSQEVSLGIQFERQKWKLENDTLFLKGVTYSSIIKTSPNLDTLYDGLSDVQIFLLEKKQNVLVLDKRRYTAYTIISKITNTNSKGIFEIAIKYNPKYSLGLKDPKSDNLNSVFNLNEIELWNKNEMDKELYKLRD